MMPAFRNEPITTFSQDSHRFLKIPRESSLQALYEDPASPPLLRRVLSYTLSWQQRVELTVGHTLLSPHQAPSLLSALFALETRVVGVNDVANSLLADLLPRKSFYQGVFDHLLIPIVPRQKWGEAHIARMPGDASIVGAVAVVQHDEEQVRKAHISLTGVCPEAVYMAFSPNDLVGNSLDDKHIDLTAEVVKQEVRPHSDHLATAAYRREMAAVLTRRVLQQCQKGINEE